MNIAICDDVKKEAELLENLCHELNYQHTTLFLSGEEFLSSPSLHDFNILFLDIEMPGISGLELMKRLSFSHPSLLVIFCTTHQELMQDAFGRNVIAFINKPYHSHSVKNALETAAGLLKDFYPVQMEDSPAILCRDGSSHLCRRSLKSLLEELSPYGFCAISRSTVVNLKYCGKIKDGKLFLTTKESLSISRRYSHSFIQNYRNFIAGVCQPTSTSAP